MALLDVVSIASIMPFVATISNPDIIKNYEELMFLYEISGADSDETFILLLGLVFVSVLIFSLAFKAFTTLSLLRFSHSCEYKISKRLEVLFNQPL